MYNVAKVSRRGFLPFFPVTFDALCKLSADADADVQNAAHLLDRLVKDIVAESGSFDVRAFAPMLRERITILNPYASTVPRGVDLRAGLGAGHRHARLSAGHARRAAAHAQRP